MKTCMDCGKKEKYLPYMYGSNMCEDCINKEFNENTMKVKIKDKESGRTWTETIWKSEVA